MNGMKRKSIIIEIVFIVYFFCNSLFSQTTNSSISSGTMSSNVIVDRVAYYKNMFGNVHQNPLKTSNVLTTLSCGQPIQIIKVLDNSVPNDWEKVKVGPYIGFIKKDFLLDKRPKCFQDSYSKFFDKFNFDIAELYYWAKLYDQYLIDKSGLK